MLGPLYNSARGIQNLTAAIDEDFASLVNITSAEARVELRDIISAEEIEYTFGTRLYSSWSTRYFDLFNNNELTNELLDEENEENDRTLRIIRVNSHTGEFVSLRIQRLVCQLFGIFTEQSEEIQIALRDFGLVNGNRTICPLTSQFDDPIQIHRTVPLPTPTLRAVGSQNFNRVFESGVESIEIEDIYRQENNGEIMTVYYDFTPEGDSVSTAATS